MVVFVNHNFMDWWNTDDSLDRSMLLFLRAWNRENCNFDIFLF